MDPSVGVMPLGEWVPIWADAHDVSATTWAEYDPRLRNHVLPRFGDVPLKAISRLAAKGWVKTLRRSPAERCSPVDAVSGGHNGVHGPAVGRAGRRARVDLARRVITIEPDKGALHEVGGRLEPGPPKSKAGVRTVHLPPFLVDLLAEHRAGRMQDHVSTGLDGGLLRRSNFRRRVRLPLRQRRSDPRVGADPPWPALP
ncbi:tyrosine-type recombinase/integrase [Actinosynnema sp. NPDC004786]